MEEPSHGDPLDQGKIAPICELHCPYGEDHTYLPHRGALTGPFVLLTLEMVCSVYRSNS